MNLLLLHGAIGSETQFDLLKNKLAARFDVHTLNFSGHGGRPIPAEEFSIALFARDVLDWMEERSVSGIDVFGYSMGGYVALYLAKHHPEKVGKILTLATKFNWSPDIAQQEIKLLNPEKIIEKLSAFAETLAKRHAPSDWKTVLQKTAGMMLEMGSRNVLTEQDFQEISSKTMISVGDRDKMVSIEETVNVYRQLKNGSLLVLPETSHAAEGQNLEMLVPHLLVFFK